ncbi:zinc-dependent alcohol dehydrogenase family protein [Amycolatopsis rubida]|uniref:2-desacetyl-2-hydroxyethyl bacteriochlorophyllide A dehydrogenase n=1 Tax=Amycolatopsis rubida TaxID=112413 RepID=A0A1I5Y2A4_9PSEU|nr:MULTISPECIES: zinc-dependent alcohol dehydrogenase family protein [Amycolatopsis]MYW91048.1 alcohol dehydrogenase catalytic domain-containing protein [Amycolatopsis rubida]NEC56033.1 zinc-dependent alcohol dehydrogenase family protein [Amycolatopsis rubida]OAP22154.1 D-arabitol-phosphate dehydrogenase [Amycolatopsis sp. M39]SFQ38391.1 2-desacetyl-2-hydroxyethyl bacteriochlorophyllide A dehydrogenase [Amycolatopsis rubida]
MRAAIVDRPGEIRVGEVPDPKPGERQVVVKVGACGICGTDLHIADGHFPPTPYPIVPGHEFSGEIVELGADVPAEWKVGDRVAVDPSIYCGYCTPCRSGHGNLCANWNATGDTVNGAFAEYVAVPADTCYRMPDSMTWEQGALVEPVSCAVHGVRRIGVEAGERFLVVGAGTMGLIMQQLLLRAGAHVTMVDRNAARLPRATDLGAAAVAADMSELDDERFDAAVDCTGAAPAIEAAFNALHRGGRLLVFGVAPAEARVALSPFRIYNDEITIVGSMAVLNSYGNALDLVANGYLDTEALITDTLPLKQYPEALAKMRSGSGLKIQVLPGGGGGA